jgi:hypothetical protein
MDYSFYFQMKNGFFITKAQMQQGEVHKLKKRVNLDEFLLKNTKHRNIEELKKQLAKEKCYRGLLTVCIDVENVLLAKIDMDDENDLDRF